MKIKILDFYILKKFLGTFIFAIMLISIIIIIFDISEKLDDFITRHAPMKAIVFDYYCNFVPYLVNLFSPLFTFIAVVFFTSRMAARSEIIAILSSGISFRRLMAPYIAGSVFIAAMSLYLNHILIPDANKIRLAFENRYVHNPYKNDEVNIHRQISPGENIYMEHFDNSHNMGIRFSLEHVNRGLLNYKLMSESIAWDSIKKKWRIYNYFIRTISPEGRQTLKSGMEMDTALKFSPSEFTERLSDKEAMNYKELNDYIREMKMQGSTNIAFYEVERDKRTAFPFATFILTFIGMSLSSRNVKGGTGFHLGMGLLIAFSFILLMHVSTTYGEGGIISPMVSVWIPNLIYGVIAFFVLRFAPK